MPQLCRANSKEGFSVEYRESYCKEDRYSCYVFWISEAASLKKQALELSGTNKMMK
jgi:hypothetical protein